ncbi:MAG: Dabb family protein [Bacteroidota bacterium]
MRQFICLLFFLTFFTMTTFAQSNNDNVRHVVVFKYKADASKADIQKVTDSFRDLQNKIPGIVSFEHGINNSPEGLNKGFTHVYLLTFENAEARDTYLPHPNHKEFGNLLSELGVLEEVFVVDYTVGE